MRHIPAGKVDTRRHGRRRGNAGVGAKCQQSCFILQKKIQDRRHEHRILAHPCKIGRRKAAAAEESVNDLFLPGDPFKGLQGKNFSGFLPVLQCDPRFQPKIVNKIENLRSFGNQFLTTSPALSITAATV